MLKVGGVIDELIDEETQNNIKKIIYALDAKLIHMMKEIVKTRFE